MSDDDFDVIWEDNQAQALEEHLAAYVRPLRQDFATCYGSPVRWQAMLKCERCQGANPEYKPLRVHGNKLKCDRCIKRDREILEAIGAQAPKPDMYWRPKYVAEEEEEEDEEKSATSSEP